MISMMTSGHAIKAPVTRQTKNGSDYVTLLIATPCGEGQQLVNVTAFDSDLCRVLAGVRKGEDVTVSGRAALGLYEGKDGPQVSVQLTATRVMAMGEVTAKPRARQPRQAKPDGRQFDARDAYRRPAPANDFDPELNDPCPI
ncbi:single-stranded DNA-binding protein [Methylococcus capsulatus]|uniref:single-stranded DNA-binding protein n=1 Tax=Methylococcus capsulatus TaxID=414 RepID=UPI001C5308C0|nr:single-stranded DNA-binding protein [Methylococcus capsulatus]QXP89110.1 single-stranded DNA-binding protein [Methylococcus capsulatus]